MGRKENALVTDVTSSSHSRTFRLANLWGATPGAMPTSATSPKSTGRPPIQALPMVAVKPTLDSPRLDRYPLERFSIPPEISGYSHRKPGCALSQPCAYWVLEHRGLEPRSAEKEVRKPHRCLQLPLVPEYTPASAVKSFSALSLLCPVPFGLLSNRTQDVPA